jgi:hypothetical protein
MFIEKKNKKFSFLNSMWFYSGSYVIYCLNKKNLKLSEIFVALKYLYGNNAKPRKF